MPDYLKDRFSAWLSALRRLGLDGPEHAEQQRAIAAMLGLTGRRDRAAGESARLPPAVDGRRLGRSRSGGDKVVLAPVEGEPGPGETDGPDDAWLAARTTAAAGVLPDWYEDVDALPSSEKFEAYKSPRMEPIFLPRHTRSILTGALSTPQLSNEFDLNRLIATLVLAEPVKHVPRLVRLLPARGVQVLCDRSEAFAPLFEDQEQLIARLDRYFTREKVQVLYFKDCPVDGLPGRDRHEIIPYEPPQARSAVLVLSGLGGGRFAQRGWSTTEVSKWARFARQVRDANCYPVAFVPFPPRQVPMPLRRAIAIVPWSRHTTVGQAYRIAAAGARP